MKTSLYICEYFVNWCTVTFMSSFPYDYILQRKSVRKIWQEIIVIFSFIRYVNVMAAHNDIIKFIDTLIWKKINSLKNISLLFCDDL